MSHRILFMYMYLFAVPFKIEFGLMALLGNILGLFIVFYSSFKHWGSLQYIKLVLIVISFKVFFFFF